MAENEMRAENFEKWLKLAFRMIVGNHWDEVSSQIVHGDKTYRWCREIIRNSLADLEHSANKFLSAAIVNIKNEIWQLRYSEFKESQAPFSGFSVWDNTFNMAFDLTRNLLQLQGRLCALKLAIVAGSFGDYEEKKFLSLKAKVLQVFLSLKDENTGSEASKDVNEAFYIFVDFLGEFEINTEEERARMGRRIEGNTKTWKAPESWCFGDFGDKEGQMEYPVNVLVNDQGEFLVLEQDSKGKNTIQRLQLFNQKGGYQRTLLQRGRDGVTSMSGMALDNTGNVVVTMKDEEAIGRVNVYNMQGELIRAIKVLIPNPKFPPFFTRVAVDKEDRTLVVEHHEMAVHIFGKDGKFIFKFGQGGRSAQQGVFENISCLAISPSNEIFICDPLRSVQVFNSSGEFLRYFKSSEVIPTHVVVGENDVYCVNRDAHALEVYSLDGKRMLRKAGGFGGELGRLWIPLGIAKTIDGFIAVAEKESHRIQVIKI